MRYLDGCISVAPIFNMTKTSVTLTPSAFVTGTKRETVSRHCWKPNADVFVTEGRLVIKVELAGMRREDLELCMDGQVLIVSGKRPDGCREGKCKFQVMEIDYGTFERELPVPPEFDLSQAQAVYQNGFLRVDIPPLKSSKRTLAVSGD